MKKKVKYLLPSAPINMGGIIVKQALPTMKVEQVDPFLLIHHANFKFRNDAPAKHQGIGPHPHRGFSPVTFVIEGELHHQDSRGNNQIAKKGEVQWMHAGAGIIHSERPSQALVDAQGNQEIIQLWINTPAANKMKVPHYQYLPEKDIPSWSSNGITNKLIAGSYQGYRGKIQTESELLIIWSESGAEGTDTFIIPTNFNCALYVIRGELTISGYGIVSKEDFIVFESGIENEITISTGPDTQLLILSGAPLNEKLAQQGPFVMNSQTEILEAMRDYQMGKMGVLIEE